MKSGPSDRSSKLVVIVGVIALAIMILGRQSDVDWLIPSGTVLLGAVLVSPAGRFLQEDDFRTRIFGAHVAQQLGGRAFQILLGVAVAAAGVCWWLVTLLIAVLSSE
jgi:hypothetical protein